MTLRVFLVSCDHTHLLFSLVCWLRMVALLCLSSLCLVSYFSVALPHSALGWSVVYD